MQLKDPAVFVHEESELWQLWVPRAHSSISAQRNNTSNCNHNLYEILLHLLDKKKTHLRTSYDFAHLADLAPVVQKMDNPIQSINLYPVDSAFDYLIHLLPNSDLSVR